MAKLLALLQRTSIMTFGPGVDYCATRSLQREALVPGDRVPVSSRALRIMEFKATQYIDGTSVRTRLRRPGAGPINVDPPIGRSKITPASCQIALGGAENVSI